MLPKNFDIQRHVAVIAIALAAALNTAAAANSNNQSDQTSEAQRQLQLQQQLLQQQQQQALMRFQSGSQGALLSNALAATQASANAPVGAASTISAQTFAQLAINPLDIIKSFNIQSINYTASGNMANLSEVIGQPVGDAQAQQLQLQYVATQQAVTNPDRSCTTNCPDDPKPPPPPPSLN